MWVVQRNNRIFLDKARTLEDGHNSFLTSFLVSCTKNFKGALLNLIQLDWMLVCNSKDVD